MFTFICVMTFLIVLYLAYKLVRSIYEDAMTRRQQYTNHLTPKTSNMSFRKELQPLTFTSDNIEDATTGAIEFLENNNVGDSPSDPEIVIVLRNNVLGNAQRSWSGLVGPGVTLEAITKFLMIFLVVFSLAGCYSQPQYVPVGQVQSTGQPYDYVQGPGGQQMVACYDNSGTRFLLDYMLFNSLMNSGGYGGVMGYYHSYPTRVTMWNNSYSSWNHFSGRPYAASSWRSSYTYHPASNSSFRANPARPSSFRPTNAPRANSSFRPSSGGSSFRPSSSPSRSSFRRR